MPVEGLDPLVMEGLQALGADAFDFGTLDYAGLVELRSMLGALGAQEPQASGMTVTDRVVPGEPGDPDITVRGIKPADSEGPLPLVYWIHGGGFIFGSGLMPDPRLEHWVKDLGCCVVSVEYRLAPESPFPAALHDCYAGLRWAVAALAPSRVVVVGASAGGGLAASLSHLVRDRGELHLDYLALIYPMIDDRRTTPSSQLDTVVWTPGANRLGWEWYLGEATETPVLAAVARATDLSGLPPTFVGVGGLDLFRDEDVQYALRLAQAGIPTELHVYPGAPHGFEIMTTAPVAQQCNRDLDDAIRRAIA
jgi:acetyl esterase/lipase